MFVIDKYKGFLILAKTVGVTLNVLIHVTVTDIGKTVSVCLLFTYVVQMYFKTYQPFKSEEKMVC